jgi:uridine kinase
MMRWTPRKADTLAALAAEILHNYRRGRVVVGVDGLVGSGMLPFADALAAAIAEAGHEVHRASRGTLDDASFRSAVIDPFRAGGDSGTAAAPASDAPAVLVVDGTMLQRPALRGAFAFTVWLDVQRAVAAERRPERATAEEVDAEARYLAEVAPRGRASAIIDTTDIDAPRRVFADSC